MGQLRWKSEPLRVHENVWRAAASDAIRLSATLGQSSQLERQNGCRQGFEEQGFSVPRSRSASATQTTEDPKYVPELSARSPGVSTHTTAKKTRVSSTGTRVPQPRKGRLNYIENGKRFFELVFDDDDQENGDGPLTVQTIVSTRVVGEVDSWAESDVW